MTAVGGKYLQRPGFACVVAPRLLQPRIVPTQIASTCVRELHPMAYSVWRSLGDEEWTQEGDISANNGSNNPRAVQRKHETLEHSAPLTLVLMLFFKKSTSRSAVLLTHWLICMPTFFETGWGTVSHEPRYGFTPPHGNAACNVSSHHDIHINFGIPTHNNFIHHCTRKGPRKSDRRHLDYV